MSHFMNILLLFSLISLFNPTDTQSASVLWRASPWPLSKSPPTHLKFQATIIRDAGDRLEYTQLQSAPVPVAGAQTLSGGAEVLAIVVMAATLALSMS